MGLILQRNTDVLTTQDCECDNNYSNNDGTIKHVYVYILAVTVLYAWSTWSHLIFTIILRGRHNTDRHQGKGMLGNLPRTNSRNDSVRL